MLHKVNIAGLAMDPASNTPIIISVIVPANASLQMRWNKEVPVPGQHPSPLSGNQVDPGQRTVLLEVSQD